MVRTLVVALVLGIFALGSTPVASACAATMNNPPCGPIPVWVELTVPGTTKGLMFGNETQLAFQASVSVVIDIDQDGFWYDQENPPRLLFNTPKTVPWVSVSYQPESYDLPVGDPNFIQADPANPGQSEFRWSGSVIITLKKERDPDPVAELAKGKSVSKRDGQYRVVAAAVTTSSYFAPNVASGWGLQEGYAQKEYRLFPEIGGERLVRQEDGSFEHEGVRILMPQPKGESPFPLLAGPLALVFALAWRRRSVN